MSTSLQRRIRRIGLLPTTFTEFKEEILIRHKNGGEEKVVNVIRKPVRHCENLSPDVKDAIIADLKQKDVVRRQIFYSKRKAAKAKKDQKSVKKPETATLKVK